MHPIVEKITSAFTRAPRNLTMPVDDTGERRAQIPEWFYFPAFGQPRNVNITRIRELAELPWVDICVTTLTDKFSTLDYRITPKDKGDYSKENLKKVRDFFLRPNQNGETEQHIRRQWCRDLLQIDAGVLVKVFSKGSYGRGGKQAFTKSVYKGVKSDNGLVDELDAFKSCEAEERTVIKEYRPLKELGGRELVELYARDGSTFQPDADVTGFIHRYFQYSFKIPKKEPLVFDKDEISYSMRYPRSYSFYGWSVVQSIEQVLLTLKSQVQYYLGYFRERGTPDGIITILEAHKDELKRLKEYWKKERIGRHHRFAITARDVKFTPVILNSRDMEILATQQWLSKLAMAMFHVNIPIITLRGEAPKAGVAGLQKGEYMDALKPIIQEWESVVNNDIIPEILQLPPDEVDVEYKLDVYDIEEDERVRAMQRADVSSGILTINEVRENERGLDPVPWGDEPATFMPLETKLKGGA